MPHRALFSCYSPFEVVQLDGRTCSKLASVPPPPPHLYRCCTNLTPTHIHAHARTHTHTHTHTRSYPSWLQALLNDSPPSGKSYGWFEALVEKSTRDITDTAFDGAVLAFDDAVSYSISFGGLECVRAIMLSYCVRVT